MLFRNIINKSNDNKVRIRTNNELKIRKYEFLELCKILDNLKIKYFLQGGVLLGAVRNNDFIPWDWDVEISVFSDEIINKIDDLLLIIKDSKFSIIKHNKKLSSFKIDLVGSLPHTVTKYSIMGWNHNNNKNIFWRNTLKIPDHFLINMVKIKLFNKLHFAPYPTEKYLTHQYGNWKKPHQTSNKHKYLTNKFYGRNIFGDFSNKIINLIKRYL